MKANSNETQPCIKLLSTKPIIESITLEDSARLFHATKDHPDRFQGYVSISPSTYTDPLNQNTLSFPYKCVFKHVPPPTGYPYSQTPLKLLKTPLKRTRRPTAPLKATFVSKYAAFGLSRTIMVWF
jgi:hypothetical protein